mmetsp:Transcript_13348/g.47129  ORF Transcript_13348/g.47129 Transcript_13348/m.47129 type:complete len:369 (-) Transcript_13348:1501-2607(-)
MQATPIGTPRGRPTRRPGAATTPTRVAPRTTTIATPVRRWHGACRSRCSVATRLRRLAICFHTTATPGTRGGTSVGLMSRSSGAATTRTEVALPTSTNATMTSRSIGTSASRCIAAITSQKAATSCPTTAPWASTSGRMAGRARSRCGAASTEREPAQWISMIATLVTLVIGTSRSRSTVVITISRVVTSFPMIATLGSTVGRSAGRKKRKIGAAQTEKKVARRKSTIAALKRPGIGTWRSKSTAASTRRRGATACPTIAARALTGGRSVGPMRRKSGVAVTKTKGVLIMSTIATMPHQTHGIWTSSCFVAKVLRRVATSCPSIATLAMTIGRSPGRTKRRIGAATTDTKDVWMMRTIVMWMSQTRGD